MQNRVFFPLRLDLFRPALLALMLVYVLLPALLNSAEVSSIVFTFDPPCKNGVNLNNQLFAKIQTVLGNKNDPTSIAGQIDREGAIWRLSKNFSGIQFAIIYPEKAPELIDHANRFIESLANEIDRPTANLQPAFIEKLLNCSPPDIKPPEHAPISLNTHGISLDDFYQLKQTLDKLQPLYGSNKTDLNCKLPVVGDASPAIIKVFTWNRIDSSSFFSAKFIGEKFGREIDQPNPTNYEIIYKPGILQLYLIASGTQQELFQFFGRIEEFCQNIDGIKNSPEWKFYAGAAGQILVQDRRDLNKNLLQKAWLDHFHAEFPQSENINFKTPDKTHEMISMPVAQQHLFSRSDKSFPRIIAARSSGSNRICDLAIRIIADGKIIEEIIKTFDADQSLSFPISILREGPQTMSMQFHADNELVPRQLSGIRSRILNRLALKNLINDLPTELSVSIAGTSDVPPFLLRGLLQQGWPSDPAEYSWRLASREELAEVLQIDPENSEALTRKWSLKTINGKGKAQLLSVLISKGLYINSFAIE
jgi:hypothetical protein